MQQELHMERSEQTGGPRVPKNSHAERGGTQVENRRSKDLATGKDQQHLKSLREKSEVIGYLSTDYGITNEQLQPLYSGVGYTGMDRFKKEPGGSFQSRVHKNLYNEDLVNHPERILSDKPVPTAITAEKPPEGTAQTGCPNSGVGWVFVNSDSQVSE